VWPLLTLYAIGRCTQRNGPTIKTRTGKGICRQMVEQGWLALAYTLPPKWYTARGGAGLSGGTTSRPGFTTPRTTRG